MGFRHFHMVGPFSLHALGTETANFNGNDGTDDLELNVETARTVEIWIVTSAVGASGSLVINVETSLDLTGAGVNFVEKGQTSAITTNTTNSLVFNRADHTLGKRLRITGEISVGTIDVVIDMIKME